MAPSGSAVEATDAFVFRDWASTAVGVTVGDKRVGSGTPQPTSPSASSMNPRKTRVLCWMTALLHFNKLLQIPLLVLHKICDIPFHEMINVFTNVKKPDLSLK